MLLLREHSQLGNQDFALISQDQGRMPALEVFILGNVDMVFWECIAFLLS